MADRRAVLVGADAGGLRRMLGPTAWVVLEELLAHSHASTGSPSTVSWRAAVSVRSLAKELGLSNDTVARAVRRLRDEGIVQAVQARTGAGTFTTGSYTIVVPEQLTVIDERTDMKTPPTSSTKAARAQRRHAQLVLAIDP